MMLPTVDPAVKRAIDEHIARAHQDNNGIKTQMTELQGEDKALLEKIDSFKPRYVRLKVLYVLYGNPLMSS
jgi:hypothetical protein